MKEMPLIYYFVNNRRYSRTFTIGHLSTTATSLQWPFFLGRQSIRNLSTMAMATSLQWPLSSVPKVAVVRGSTVYKRGTFSVKNGIQLLRERLSEKVHATMPKGIVGGFQFTVQRNLQEWHERPWTYVYNC